MFESYHRFPAATFWRKQFFLPLVLLRIFISLSLFLRLTIVMLPKLC